MHLVDALTITGLGMAVVFCGLLLTAALIVVFGQVQRLLDRRATAEVPVPAQPAVASAGPAPGPEIVAVISAVLEVERRLRRTGGNRRGAGFDEAEQASGDRP